MPSTLDLSLSKQDGVTSSGTVTSTVSDRADIAIRSLRFNGLGHVESMTACTHFCFDLKGHRGSFEWRSAGKYMSGSSRPGALYLMPSGADFSVDTTDGADVLTFMVSDETLGLAAGELAVSGLHVDEIVGGEDVVLLAIGRAMEREAALAFPNGPLFWSSMTDRVAEHLISEYRPATRVPMGGRLPSRAIGRINDFIEASLDTPISIDDLARVAAQSRFHFQRTFRRSFGLTPHRYVMLVRLRRAVSLIRSGPLPLAAIAVDTGFVDQSHLARWIKAVYGMTPSGMRDH